MSIWSIYLIRSARGHLYTGVTTDVERRLEQHRTGKGAKYLKGKGPLTLEWRQQLGDKSTALKTEYRIKQLPKADKERLITKQLLLSDIVTTE